MIKTALLKLQEAWLRLLILSLAEERDEHLARAGRINGNLASLQKTRNALVAEIAARRPRRPRWAR